jgi:hypothetical protein
MPLNKKNNLYFSSIKKIEKEEAINKISNIDFDLDLDLDFELGLNFGLKENFICSLQKEIKIYSINLDINKINDLGKNSDNDSDSNSNNNDDYNYNYNLDINSENKNLNSILFSSLKENEKKMYEERNKNIIKKPFIDEKPLKLLKKIK